MKKNLSKLLALALALTMALSLTACGGGDKPAENPDNTNTIASSNDNSTESPDNSEEPVTSTPAENEPVEMPEQPEEPEVPSEIEIVAGETYIVKDYLDITFGELSHSEYNESGHYTTIELPVTITLNMAETPLYVDLDAKSYEANDGGCNGEFELYYTGEQPSPVGPNELEPGQTYELLIRGPLYCSNQVPPYGHIEIVVQDTTFTTPYDISDIF